MKKYMFLWLLSLVFVVIGCEEEDVDYEELRQEGRYFDLYMDANYPEWNSDDEDFYFESYEVGDGISPDTGDYVLVNYIAYTIPDETVVDTYVEEWATDYNLYNSNVLYGPYKYKHGTEIEGLQKLKILWLGIGIHKTVGVPYFRR